MDLQDQLNHALLRALSAHGVELSHKDGWVVGADGEPALRAMALVQTDEDTTRAQLNVQVGLPDGRLLIDSHGAMASTPEAAVQSTLQKFAANAAPVLASAFFDRDVTTRERWTIDGAEWSVHLSTIGLEITPGPGTPPPDPKGPPPVVPPQELGAEVHRLIQGCRGLPSPSWMRVFFAFQDKERVGHEVVFNGEYWPEAADALAKLDWGEYEGFYSVRLFLILTEVTPSAPRWPHDFRQTMVLVCDVVERMEHDPPPSDDDVCEALIDAGVDFEVAESLVCFTPAAFAYWLLRDLGLPADYALASEQGALLGTRPLEAEPAFVAAREVAATFDAASNPALAHLATRSDIFNIVGAALAEGRTIPNAYVVRVVDEDPVEAEAAADAQEPGSDEAAPEATGSDEPAARPWWRVWG